MAAVVVSGSVMAMRAFTALLFAAAMLFSCKEDEWSQVTVYVTADPMIRAQTSDLKISITAIVDGTSTVIESGDQLYAIDPESWPYRIGLSPTKDPRQSRYRVVVEAIDDSGPSENVLLKVSATSGYVPNKSKALVLHFKDPCIAKWRECDALAGSSTCKVLNGQPICVDDKVDENSLPDLPSDNTVLPPDPDAGIDGGGPQPCLSYFDCDDGIYCTVDLCINGTCQSFIDTNPDWTWTCPNAGDRDNLCHRSRCEPQNALADADGCVYETITNTPMCDPNGVPTGQTCGDPATPQLGELCANGIDRCYPNQTCRCESTLVAEDPSTDIWVCFDGYDNDCDGKIDGDDEGCWNQLASPFGERALPGGGAECPPPGVESCDTAGDEDCDGFADCSDADCFSNPNCTVNREADCSDGSDDGGLSGYADCDDPTCAGQSCGPGNTGVCSPGVPPFESGRCEGGETLVCDDGVDNDGDDRIDCEDRDCENQACASGAGFCVFGDGPPGTVGYCDVPEICTQDASGNFSDNDGDGLSGCDDGDCQFMECGRRGNARLACDNFLTQSVFVCSERGFEVEGNCHNGVDDDGDGFVDCLDQTNQVDGEGDCWNRSCGEGGAGVCSTSPPYTCAGGETSCGDGIDNDHDGRVDCYDTDCVTAICAPGAMCNKDIIGDCQAGMLASGCALGLDADYDGLIGCADPDCNGITCPNGSGLCSSAGAVEDRHCDGGEATGCDNGFDDDGDGFIDCQDPDCYGQSCVEGFCTGVAGTNMPFGDRECNGGIEDCENQADDDFDGLLNCQDPECAGKQCGSGLGICSPLGTPLDQRECIGIEGMLPDTCQNKSDDDSDGLTDCQDPQCDGKACGSGNLCYSRPDLPAHERHCRALQGESATPERCDGTDSDGDKLVDCADPDCASKPCAGGMGLCTGPTVRADEKHCISAIEACDTQADVDGDGLFGCQDPDCYKAVCGPGGSGVCTSSGLLVDDRHCMFGETNCSDGNDLDDDGLADCEDPDCYNQPCSGGTCTGLNLPLSMRTCTLN